jgi:hypothetical protein
MLFIGMISTKTFEDKLADDDILFANLAKN